MTFILLIYCFIIGISIGSFLNVLIDRLPNDESVVKGRSHCDHCKRTLNWYELIPLFSFIFQGGKSGCCHKKLSYQYPLIELLTGIGFVWIYQTSLNFSSNYWELLLITNLVIYCCLLVIFVADLKTFIIPDQMIITGIIASLCRILILNLSQNPILLSKFSIFSFPFGYAQGMQFSINYILAAVGASIFFYLLYVVTRGRGMGFGDVKLAIILGLITGFPGIIINLYVAFLTGAFIGVILILYRQKSFKSQVPFGPFLIAGTLVTMLWQTQILNWWKGVI
jgi:leader peptidase (prepilin peptidase) / N-methyltransferase